MKNLLVLSCIVLIPILCSQVNNSNSDKLAVN